MLSAEYLCLFFLREQRAAAECEVFVCGERRDSEIKLAQRVLSRFVYKSSRNVLAPRGAYSPVGKKISDDNRYEHGAIRSLYRVWCYLQHGAVHILYECGAVYIMKERG